MITQRTARSLRLQMVGFGKWLATVGLVVLLISPAHAQLSSGLSWQVHPTDANAVLTPADGPAGRWLLDHEPVLVTHEEATELSDLYGPLAGAVRYEVDEPVTGPWSMRCVWRPFQRSFYWADGQLASITNAAGTTWALRVVRHGRLAITRNGQRQALSPRVNWSAKESKAIYWRYAGGWSDVMIDDQLVLRLQHDRKAPPIDVVSITVGGGHVPLLASGGTFAEWSFRTEMSAAPAGSDVSDVPYTNPIAIAAPKIVRRLEAVRSVNPGALADPDLRGQLAALQVAWDAWLQRYGQQEELDAKTSEHQSRAFAELTVLLDAIEPHLGSTARTDAAAPPRPSGPWRPQDGRLRRDGSADFYLGFIGWSMSSAVPDIAHMNGNLVSISVWPSMLIDEQGRVREDVWQETVQRTLDLGLAYGVAVDVLITPYTTPQLARDNPHWQDTCGHGFVKACVLDPVYNDFAADFTTVVAQRVADHPAVTALCVGNEIQFDEHCARSLKRFRDRVKQRFASIKAFNEAYNTDYASIDDISLAREDVHAQPPLPFIELWREHMWQVGNDHMLMLAETAKQAASNLPVHVKTLPYEFGLPWMQDNPSRWKLYDYPDGVDRRTLAREMSFIGTDSWANNPRGNPPWGITATYQLMYYDYLQGLAPDKPLYDSEWHIVNEHKRIAPDLFRTTVWLDLAHGLDAGAIWVWHEGIEPMTFLNQPALMAATARTFEQTRRFGPALRQIADQRHASVALLYDPHTLRAHRDGYVMAMESVYRQLTSLGINPHVLDARDVTPDMPMDRIDTVICFAPDGTPVPRLPAHAQRIEVRWPASWSRRVEPTAPAHAASKLDTGIRAPDLRVDDAQRKWHAPLARAVRRHIPKPGRTDQPYGVSILQTRDQTRGLAVNLLDTTRRIHIAVRGQRRTLDLPPLAMFLWTPDDQLLIATKAMR